MRSVAYPFCQSSDGGELRCFGRESEDRSELAFGVDYPGLSNHFLQQLKSCLRQPQQVQHLRHSRPADSTAYGDLGLAVNHTFVEQPLELESLLDRALQAAFGLSQ